LVYRYRWNIGGTFILIILWIILVPHNKISGLEIAIELFQIVFIILFSIIIAKDRTIPKFEEKNI